MAYEEKLPWELTEEILSRVPPKSLVRFRTVSKQWNALSNDKIFIRNHKTTFQFILTAKSKIYSVSIFPKIEVRELTLEIPGLESEAFSNLVDYNEFLLCEMDKGAVVCNPWLRQSRWINGQLSLKYNIGIGFAYGNTKLIEDSGYKIIASYHKESSDLTNTYWKIYDFASNSWKDKELEHVGRSGSSNVRITRYNLVTKGGVVLNGVLYWVAYNVKTFSSVLVYFDFSTEEFVKLCDLCGEKYHHSDALALRVFKGDKFSLLKQCHLTRKIEVWVTRNKINKWCGQDMEWMIFMEVSIPNLPVLVENGSNSQPSYFIDDKELVVCSCDEIGRAWIYVVGNNKLISKTQIDSVVDPWPLHCTYFPSLVPIPRGQREEKELQV